MNICGIDFESTGFPATRCRITEIGATCFDPEVIENADGYRQLGSFNSLVFEPDYPPQSDVVVGITGITDEMLITKGITFPQAIEKLLDLWADNQCSPDYFIAHNKSFDETLWKAELDRHEELLDPAIYRKLKDIPWLCSIQDIEHPKKFTSKKLAHLALDYGCAVDPSCLHRATDDVNLMLNMLFRAALQGAFSWAEMVGLSEVPWVVVRAVVPSPFGPKGDGGKGKDKAKALGYGYGKAHGTDGPLVDKAWLKRIRATDINKEREELGYEIKIIEETKSQKIDSQEAEENRQREKESCEVPF